MHERQRALLQNERMAWLATIRLYSSWMAKFTHCCVCEKGRLSRRSSPSRAAQTHRLRPEDAGVVVLFLRLLHELELLGGDLLEGGELRRLCAGMLRRREAESAAACRTRPAAETERRTRAQHRRARTAIASLVVEDHAGEQLRERRAE